MQDLSADHCKWVIVAFSQMQCGIQAGKPNNGLACHPNPVGAEGSGGREKSEEGSQENIKRTSVNPAIELSKVGQLGDTNPDCKVLVFIEVALN